MPASNQREMLCNKNEKDYYCSGNTQTGNILKINGAEELPPTPTKSGGTGSCEPWLTLATTRKEGMTSPTSANTELEALSCLKLMAKYKPLPDQCPGMSLSLSMYFM